jgi:beta-lactamase class D
MNKFRLLLLSCVFFSFGSCTLNHAKIDNDLKKYFDSSNVDGCFALLNNQMGTITVYNMKLDTQRLSAGTSFKIPETLIGIQTGKVINENTKLLNDSSSTGNPTLKEAFNNSSVAFFQSLAHEIGKDTLKFWLDSIGYGNKEINNSLDSILLNNNMKISPDEQLGMLSKLYFEQLPFQKYAQEMVGNMMLQKEDSLYKLSYTTGTATEGTDQHLGWNLGWIEESRHIYFFVTLIKTPDQSVDVKTTAIDVSKAVLQGLGFFKGEK